MAITEIPHPLTLQPSGKILCYYKNTTNKIQITQISNITNGYFQRIVFPGEQLLFETSPDAELEIHTVTTLAASVVDKISCSCLQVNELTQDATVPNQ